MGLNHSVKQLLPWPSVDEWGIVLLVGEFIYNSLVNPALSEALERAVALAGKERLAAESALTEKQLVKALRQALACGDFQRLVRIDDGAQAVTYMPFRHEQKLRARIRELEAEKQEIDDCIANALL